MLDQGQVSAGRRRRAGGRVLQHERIEPVPRLEPEVEPLVFAEPADEREVVLRVLHHVVALGVFVRERERHLVGAEACVAEHALHDRRDAQVLEDPTAAPQREQMHRGPHRQLVVPARLGLRRGHGGESGHDAMEDALAEAGRDRQRARLAEHALGLDGLGGEHLQLQQGRLAQRLMATQRSAFEAHALVRQLEVHLCHGSPYPVLSVPVTLVATALSNAPLDLNRARRDPDRHSRHLDGQARLRLDDDLAPLHRG